MTLTVDFAFGNALVKLRHANVRRDAFQQALMIRKLSVIYGTSDINLSEIAEIAALLPGNDTARMETLVAAKIALDPTFSANFTVFQDIGTFAELAARIVDLQADELDGWISAADTAERIDEAFQHYLAHADLWTAIKDKLAEVDKPNGVAGAHPDQLSEDEQRSPLSAKPAKRGKTTLSAVPKIRNGSGTKRD